MAFASGAAVYVRASIVRGAAVRADVPARRRSGAARRASPAGLRYFPGHQASRRDAAAGRHRRHRRGKPAKTRPVSVAANARRRHDHAPDRLGAAAIAFDIVFPEPDRLSPALAADVIRDLDEETRNKLRALPSNDQVHGRCDAAIAGGARRDRPADGPAGTRRYAACRGRGRAGRRSEAIHVQFPGTAAKRSDSRKCRRRARAVQHPHRARRHRPARADGHAGAGQRSCPRCRSRCCGWRPAPAPS